MNAKALFALTVAVALLSSGVAMASEATQFKDAPGALSRSEVKADLARARADGSFVSSSATYSNARPVLASVRSRDEVRAEARTVARGHLFASGYTTW